VKIKQISVFLENKVGHLLAVTDELKKANLNIRAISLADSERFGVVRMVVENPARAYSVLHEAGHTVRETDVIAAEVEDRPGGLADLLRTFEKCGVNIEYMYAVIEKKGDKAVIILRVEELDDALDKLSKSGMKLLSAEEVFRAL
jgi:hypothetical protein